MNTKNPISRADLLRVLAVTDGDDNRKSVARLCGFEPIDDQREETQQESTHESHVGELSAGTIVKLQGGEYCRVTDIEAGLDNVQLELVEYIGSKWVTKISLDEEHPIVPETEVVIVIEN
jgi:hypothetical protein